MLDLDFYINSVRWQHAKTMPEIPHSYTVKAWKPDKEREFNEFVRLIAREGYAEEFHGIIYHYFDVGIYKYWTMSPSIEETILINRALK